MRYVPGQRWRVTRPYRPFDFVVLGLGSKPTTKLCKVEHHCEVDRKYDFEAEYSHKHLKKYAKLVKR